MHCYSSVSTHAFSKVFMPQDVLRYYEFSILLITQAEYYETNCALNLFGKLLKIYAYLNRLRCHTKGCKPSFI
jgi:hypothetical protein